MKKSRQKYVRSIDGSWLQNFESTDAAIKLMQDEQWRSKGIEIKQYTVKKFNYKCAVGKKCHAVAYLFFHNNLFKVSLYKAGEHRHTFMKHHGLPLAVK